MIRLEDQEGKPGSKVMKGIKKSQVTESIFEGFSVSRIFFSFLPFFSFFLTLFFLLLFFFLGFLSKIARWYTYPPAFFPASLFEHTWDPG